MSIIIRDEEGDFERLDATLFENEDRLQAYITANPEAIPLYELDEGLQLLMLKREVSTDSGRVDVLGIDQKGGIYLIETKLHSNPDKRNVVAQILGLRSLPLATLRRPGRPFAKIRFKR